jgi:hypothetical protein
MFCDRYVVLYSLLVAASPSFTASVTFRKQRRQQLLSVRNPVAAVCLSTHLDRWSQGGLSDKELVSLNANTTESFGDLVGSRYQTVYMWRIVSVMMLRQKAQATWSNMKPLPANFSRSISSPGDTPASSMSHQGTCKQNDASKLFHKKLRFDAEVVERLKAREVVKYLRLTELLMASLQQREMRPIPVITPGEAWMGGSHSRMLPILGRTGLDDLDVSESPVPASEPESKQPTTELAVGANHAGFGGMISTEDGDVDGGVELETVTKDGIKFTNLPEITFAPTPKILPKRDNSLAWTAQCDIMEIMHQYGLLTNGIYDDVTKLRDPILHRDIELLEKGFIKQARVDFLNLREMCMTV